jgi:hypothetical protein
LSYIISLRKYAKSNGIYLTSSNLIKLSPGSVKPLKEIDADTFRDFINDGIDWVRYWSGSKKVDNEKIFKIAENVLAEEIKNKEKNYYVFYHACQGTKIFLYEIYCLLYSWGMLQKNQPLALRFLNLDKDIQYPSSILDVMKKVKANKMGDTTKDMVAQLLPVNVALFGNRGKMDENTFFAYFVKNSSWWPSEAEKILPKIFEQLGLPKLSEEKILTLIKEYQEQIKEGLLLQIFIKKPIIDEVVYLSRDYGFPIEGTPPESMPDPLKDSWNKESGFYTKISPFLEEYINYPEKLASLLNKFKFGKERTYYLDNFDALQARIWLASPYLYDPKYVKIISYSIDQGGAINQFSKELASVINSVIKEFIKQKLIGKIVFPVIPAFKSLDLLISECISEMEGTEKQLKSLGIVE